MERVERATWDRWAATVAAKSRETNEFNLLLFLKHLEMYRLRST